jgi:tRNA A37 N6-isopentenylltransferase MiaA
MQIQQIVEKFLCMIGGTIVYYNALDRRVSLSEDAFNSIRQILGRIECRDNHGY